MRNASVVGSALKDASSRQSQLPVWLTYLWQRRNEDDRLGLVLGAGVSREAGIPMWADLLKRLTRAARMPAGVMALHKKARLPETFQAEIIFRRHSAHVSAKNDHLSKKFKRLFIDEAWREKIHGCLYKDVKSKSFEDLVAGHTYIRDLAELVWKTKFTVTFNFDDIIDEATANYAGTHGHVNPEVIFEPKLETRKNAPVIYHINGILPREELRRCSEKIILTEDAFADIMLSPSSRDADFVISQFSVRTFLLIGISLTDNSLKNLLRASAHRNPANHHFIVIHEDLAKPRSKEERDDIFDVNLHVYNLISLFLSTEELLALIEVLNSKEGARLDEILQHIVTAKIDRKYYLIGSVAAGKSTTLEALRCFTTHEEWSGRVPAVMYLDDSSLTPDQQKEVDDFLFPQLMTKNKAMIRLSSGIRIMDRAYLDLFAFSDSKVEVKRKAEVLVQRVKWGGQPLEKGQIVFLKATKSTFEERLARRGHSGKRKGKVFYDADKLVQQEEKLIRAYRPSDNDSINTSECTVGEAARDIARRILLGQYTTFDFTARIDEIISQDGDL